MLGHTVRRGVVPMTQASQVDCVRESKRAETRASV